MAKSKTLIAEKDELAGSLTEARGGTDEVVSKLAELEAKLDVAMQEKGELADVNQELRGDLGELEKLLAESGKLLDETVAELSRSNAALRERPGFGASEIAGTFQGPERCLAALARREARCWQVEDVRQDADVDARLATHRRRSFQFGIKRL